MKVWVLSSVWNHCDLIEGVYSTHKLAVDAQEKLKAAKMDGDLGSAILEFETDQTPMGATPR
jgi:hypothetical protein